MNKEIRPLKVGDWIEVATFYDENPVFTVTGMDSDVWFDKPLFGYDRLYQFGSGGLLDDLLKQGVIKIHYQEEKIEQ